MKDHIYEDLSVILRRVHISFLILAAAFVVMVLFFWKMQALDHKKYWELSEANRIRETVLPAQRGLIRDRNGEVLATNVASFRASVIRENSSDLEGSYAAISGLLGLEIEVIKERVEKFRAFPFFQPIVIKDNLSQEEVARIESRRIEFPELVVEAEPKRSYPHGSFAAHALGYLQEVSPGEIQSGSYPDRRIGDLIGKTGIEKKYEGVMVGESGQLLEVVDSLGRRKEELSRRDPVKGQDVFVTLDLGLQTKAEELLADREGAIVVMEVASGDVLALASFPAFDPNKFITRFTPREWIEFVNNPDHPLENRAIRGLYSPGSVFKLVMALAALDLRLISDQTTFYCSGSVRIYNHPFSCWFKPGHGRMDLYQGIQHSCNVYFYQLGVRLGIEEIARYSRKFGLGSPTGIDLSGEKAGLVPDPEWKRRTRNAPWYPGETISVSIGQGPLLVTPLQVAVMTAAIASRGRIVRPHLILSESQPSEERTIGLDPALMEKVIRGMWLCANQKGTARAARVSGFDVCGKTGSTQVVSRETAERLEQAGQKITTHSWFSGFAPRDNPKIVVTVIVEFGGMGGTTAAPMARDLFALYRQSHDQ
ncbi:MAG: penicillin-binding protein 2 [Candidatus Aminicenantes bacterium]|nr:penicillin-binding protein 2 [Candidatus Aminicenantes bacterium]